ncbi:MAG: DUF6491 family protein [Rhodanobacter sp.]
MPFRQSLVLLAVLSLVACSSVPYAQRQATRLAEYTAVAGAPVSNFRFFSLYSWEPLGQTTLAVYTRPNEAWLLDLDGGCRDLPFTPVIGVTSNLNQVSVRFDKVLTGRNQFPCTITGIRPLDIRRMKATRQAQRPIDIQPRAAAGAGGAVSLGPASGRACVHCAMAVRSVNAGTGVRPDKPTAVAGWSAGARVVPAA